MLAYWLSNTSMLLLLLQRTLKATGAAGIVPQRRRSMSTSIFARMTSVCLDELSMLSFLSAPFHSFFAWFFWGGGFISFNVQKLINYVHSGSCDLFFPFFVCCLLLLEFLFLFICSCEHHLKVHSTASWANQMILGTLRPNILLYCSNSSLRHSLRRYME